MARESKRSRTAKRLGLGSVIPLLAGTAALGYSFVGGIPDLTLPASSFRHVQAEVDDAYAVVLNDLRSAAASRDGSTTLQVPGATDPAATRVLVDVDGDAEPELVTYVVSDGYLLRTVHHRTSEGWSSEIPVAVLRGVTAFEIRSLDPARIMEITLAAQGKGSFWERTGRLDLRG